MGILSTQSSPTINHFSHHHPLHLDNHNPTLTLAPSSCSGCKVPLSQGLIYTCKLCKYHLHIKCSEMPRQIKHPFDQRHVFSLLATPAYAGGVFKCDACGEQGNGFSYRCKYCSTDLHILCASMPLSITHRLHHHNLNLVFSPPYPSKSFSCDVCKGIGGSHWLYRCDFCGFDAHLSCGTNKEMPAQLPPTAQINLHQQAMAVPIHVLQPPPPPPMSANLPQFTLPAAGIPVPGNPHVQNHQPFNSMNHVNTGGMGPNNPITNGPSQINQSTPNFYHGASQFPRPQPCQGQMPGCTNDKYAIIQLLLQLLTDNSGGVGVGVGGGGGGGGGGSGNANARLLQVISSVIGNNGGGSDGNDQSLQGMMDGGSGGGGFDFGSLMDGNCDMSSLSGGSIDISSLWGFMGGFGFS